MKVGVPLDNFFSTISYYDISLCNRWCYSKKLHGRGVVQGGKGITLVISDEDMVNIIKVIKSLENSSILIDGISGTVKHEIKKQ